MFGEFNYNATPLAPFGCKIIIFDTPQIRDSWYAHSQHGWYIGPTIEHYHCFRYYIPSTRSEIISDTVMLTSSKYVVPSYSYYNELMAAAQNLTDAITSNKKSLKQLDDKWG